MLDNLTNRLSGVIKTLRGHARLTEDNIADAMREVRTGSGHSRVPCCIDQSVVLPERVLRACWATSPSSWGHGLLPVAP